MSKAAVRISVELPRRLGHRFVLARDWVRARIRSARRHFCVRCGWIGAEERSCAHCGSEVEPYRRDVLWSCEECGESWSALRPREATGSTPTCPSCGAAEAFPGLVSRGWPEIRERAASRGYSRCAAPGCGSYHDLELVHRKPPTAGGESNLDNLVYMCPTHRWWYGRRHRLLRDPRFWGRFVRALLASVRERVRL